MQATDDATMPVDEGVIIIVDTTACAADVGLNHVIIKFNACVSGVLPTSDYGCTFEVHESRQYFHIRWRIREIWPCVLAQIMAAKSSVAENVELANGVKMPILGFGTYELKGEECRSAVVHALKVGYRHIDTASIYKNEEQIARAIAESGVSRADLFITSKLQPKDHGEKAYAACLDSLKRLETDYLDCTLICKSRDTLPQRPHLRELCRLFNSLARSCWDEVGRPCHP
jgi:hypothetical protein